MTDRDLLELIAVQVGKLTKDVDEIKGTMATKQDLEKIWATMATKQDLEKIWATMATKQDLDELRTIVIRIENDHGQKLGALFDGYRLISERLDRIEQAVNRHEEIISRRFG